MEQKRGPAYRRTIQARERVVALYEKWEKPEQATKWKVVIPSVRMTRPPPPPAATLALQSIAC